MDMSGWCRSVGLSAEHSTHSALSSARWLDGHQLPEKNEPVCLSCGGTGETESQANWKPLQSKSEQTNKYKPLGKRHGQIGVTREI